MATTPLTTAFITEQVETGIATMIPQIIGAGPIVFLQHSLQVTGTIIKIRLPIKALIPDSKVQLIIETGRPIHTADNPMTVTMIMIMIMIGAVMTGTADIQIGTAIGD